MNAAETKPCRRDELRRTGGWLPTFPRIRQLIRDGVGLAALVNQNGQPIKPLSSPSRQAIYAALCELADKHPDLCFKASHATIAAEAGVSERAVLQGIHELKALGVITYTLGAQQIPNTYCLKLPGEIPALTQQALALEDTSTANSAVSAPQISPFRAANFAAKQQDSVNQDSVKDNNTPEQGVSVNVVVVALVSLGMQQHTAQQLFQQYDASLLLEATENTKRAMKRGDVSNSAGYVRSEIKRLACEGKRTMQAPPVAPVRPPSPRVASPAADGPTRASTASQRPPAAVSRIESGTSPNEADNGDALKKMLQTTRAVLHPKSIGNQEASCGASMPAPSFVVAPASCAGPPRSASDGGERSALRSTDSRTRSDNASGVYNLPSLSPGRLDFQRQQVFKRGGDPALLAVLLKPDQVTAPGGGNRL